MAPPSASLKTTFRPAKVIQPFYTGGKVSLDQSGKILVTTLNEDVLIVDIESGEELARIEGDTEQVTTLALTPQASHLIICSRSYVMRIFSLAVDLSTTPPTVIPTLQRSLKAHTSPIIVAETDPTGTLLATGGADGLVKVWDIKGGFVTHNFRGHSGVISALKFYAPDSTDSFVSAGVADGKEKNKKNRKRKEESSGLGWRLASGADDTKIRVWDLVKSSCVAVLESHVSVVRGLDWSVDGRVLVSGSRDKVVCLWDSETWKLRSTIPVLEELEIVGFLGPGALKRGENGEEGEEDISQVIYTGGRRNRIRLWHLREGRELTQNGGEDENEDEEREAEGITDIIYHKSLPTILSIHNDQTLLIHSLKLSVNATAMPVIRRLSGHHDEIIDLQYLTPEDKLMALATNSEDVRIVDVEKGFGDVGLLQGHSDIVICLDRDWSGVWLATGGKDNDARLWRIDGEKEEFKCYAKFTGHAESIGAIALARSVPPETSGAAKEHRPPKFLITGSQDRTIKRWEVPTAGKKSKAVYTRKAHEKDINAIDVSPDDTLFASASQDRTVKIWSVEEGEVLGVLRGHKRGVWSVRFTPASVTAAVVGGAEGAKGGKMVVTGSGDKTVKLWSLTDYSCLKTFEGHTNSVLKTVWLTGGLQVASSGGDGLVKVWDVKNGECNTTLDNHEDKVWALTVRKDDRILASGGGDSVVTFWEDVSEETRISAAKAEEELVEQEQKLQNYIHNNDYRSAITLALGLNHPGRLLNLLTNATKTSPVQEGSLSGLLAVDEILRTLSDGQLFTLLCRIRDWNTNAKTATVAQRVLYVLARSYPPQRLMRLKGTSGVSVTSVWDALKSYTEKHYKRVEELVEESYLVEYTLMEMEEVFSDDDNLPDMDTNQIFAVDDVVMV
ncbi:U3 small nucleolar RNA-associated protein 13 [Rhizina undulata]